MTELLPPGIRTFLLSSLRWATCHLKNVSTKRSCCGGDASFPALGHCGVRACPSPASSVPDARSRHYATAGVRHVHNGRVPHPGRFRAYPPSARARSGRGGAALSCHAACSLGDRASAGTAVCTDDRHGSGRVRVERDGVQRHDLSVARRCGTFGQHQCVFHTRRNRGDAASGALLCFGRGGGG